MSAVDGSALVVYQGARARCSSTSAGSCPAVAYQRMARVWQASVNGTVRSTARAVRLRACPAPKTCLASSIATSMDQRAAYRSMTCGGAGGQVGGDQGEVVAGRGAVADEHDLDGAGAEDRVPQAGDGGGLHGGGLAVAGDGDRGEGWLRRRARPGRAAGRP